MAISNLGPVAWRLQIDDEGYRNYDLTYKLLADSTDIGPNEIWKLSGIPAVGSPWSIGGDSDPWAFRTPAGNIRRFDTQNENEKGKLWLYDLKFSNKPSKRCNDDSIEDPLSEPAKISGSFVKYTREAKEDRNGKAIKSSSHEMFRGSIVEFDANRPTVTIEMNLPSLLLSTFAPMIDTVNDAPLWGLPARCVKLSNAPWSREIYGTCNYYYKHRFEFDIDFKTFDRDIVDEGTKILAPGGVQVIPSDFIVYKDANGENTRVLLDGSGAPLADGDAPFIIRVEKYDETNLLSLGIPTSF